jgi:hypothetical protein
MVVWRSAALCTPAKGLPYINWLGRHVTSAYVFQWLLIGNIATAIYKSQTLPQTLLWYLIILALTSTLIALTDRIRGRSVDDERI